MEVYIIDGDHAEVDGKRYTRVTVEGHGQDCDGCAFWDYYTGCELVSSNILGCYADTIWKEEIDN